MEQSSKNKDKKIQDKKMQTCIISTKQEKSINGSDSGRGA